VMSDSHLPLLGAVARVDFKVVDNVSLQYNSEYSCHHGIVSACHHCLGILNSPSDSKV
jgi:hypothetical protein